MPSYGAPAVTGAASRGPNPGAQCASDRRAPLSAPWRAAVGFGLRINVDFFGPIPIVLDFGFPIAKDDQDDTQIFNFSFGASF